MLAFLTDEHITDVVAERVRKKRGDIRIESVLRWRDATFRGQSDEKLLAAAHKEGLSLVTYDQKTIPPILAKLGANGDHHAGVGFVDRNSIASSNIGRLVHALIACYDENNGTDWTDVVHFLIPGARVRACLARRAAPLAAPFIANGIGRHTARGGRIVQRRSAITTS